MLSWPVRNVANYAYFQFKSTELRLIDTKRIRTHVIKKERTNLINWYALLNDNCYTSIMLVRRRPFPAVVTISHNVNWRTIIVASAALSRWAWLTVHNKVALLLQVSYP